MQFGRYDYAAFCTFFSYAAGSVVIPVALVALAQDLGFTLDQGGMTAAGTLHVGRTLPMVLAMVFCGFAAGRWGKRWTLGLSTALMAVGVLVCSVAPAYGVLLVALMIAGLGEGVVEGLATPFVQSLHPAEPGRYINFTHSFWSVGVVVTVLGSGAMISLGYSWRIPVALVAAMAFFGAALILFPENKARRYPEHPERIVGRTVWRQAVAIMKIRRFWTFFAAMFVAGGGEFCLTFWCASFVQLNFVDAAWAGGVGTAFFAGGMFVGRTGWGYLLHDRHLLKLVIWSAVAGTGITILLPLLSGLWILFGVLFLAGIASAPFWPSVQSYAVGRLPQADSTMLLILLSCAGVPGCGFFTWLMGYIGNHAGLRAAFYLVPACYLVLAILMALDWMWHRRVPAGESAPQAARATDGVPAGV